MPGYCRQCQTNWSQLPREDEGEEQYEFCPTCGMDEHLDEQQPGPTCSFDRITGKVIDDETGDEVIHDPPPPPPVRPASYRDRTNDAIMRGKYKA